MVPGFLPCSAVVFIFGFHLIWTKPAMDSGPSGASNNKYEEYVVEHEISETQARNVVMSTTFKSVTSPAGCESECTKEEIRYCLSADLISDHCSCDKRVHELVPYVPHTCYVGPHLSTPVAGNCFKYTQLLNCCCDKYLLPKWKERLANDATTNCELSTLFTVITIIVFLLV